MTGFDFDATDTDYPGIHTDLSIAAGNGNLADIKWFIGAGIGYVNAQGATIQMSADHHTATLDLDLHGVGTPAPGPEHVKGTVTCP